MYMYQFGVHCLWLCCCCIYPLRVVMWLLQLLEENDIKFYFKNSVKEFTGSDGVLTGATLQDGTKLEAQLCVVGIGELTSYGGLG